MNIQIIGRCSDESAFDLSCYFGMIAAASVVCMYFIE